MRQVAALYVDIKRGPYPALEGVDCWGLPEKDATQYAGPYPVVAHPPCGHWGRYAHRCYDDGHTGPIAVEQVRRWGGVLEQPKDSKLWAHCGLPTPTPSSFWPPCCTYICTGSWLEGFSMLLHQRDWGHPADKPTWLWIVGLSSPLALPPIPPPTFPKERWTPSRRVLDPGRLDNPRPRGTRGVVECMSKTQRHLTPPAFAAWLVEVARRCRVPQ